ncbi:family 78 glycoside hydrolase catalytic domain [Niabella drilacis]|uniref:alpha-L-rhamnosidase n=1 Tax=Niabella drilacis (strain DSM 25811 / CCM 8410 / CCUG 62505 / LMG 26954 / E90) TaxID=1285928 RepID=A0A1G6HZD1_NIADE|nr:family 78 glycoside hydrolase catalytic domain [Niabella drilacis]SDB99632.1 Alpha-L-rhamnosidase N-terminal domain-containing protein [Niabella drilacis]
MKKWFFFGLLFMTGLWSNAQLKARYLRCEYLQNPLGVEDPHPRLSWELTSSQKNMRQSAYRILVADDPELLGKGTGNVWDSRKVSSDASIQIRYSGKQLASGKRYYWKVMTWDAGGRPSSFSEPALWQMGLLDKADWSGAQWIAREVLPQAGVIVPFAHGGGQDEWGRRPDVLPLLRKHFEIAKPVKQATAFISGLGHFEMHVNGEKTGDHFLDPGWTQYAKHAQYVTFDITDQLKKGENVLGVMLGNGFYYIPGERYRKLTGAYGFPKMIAKLLIEYKDGSSETVVSDNSWKTAESPIWFSSIYGGEDYDANREKAGWDGPRYNDAGWTAAVVTDGPPQLQAQPAEPVRVLQTFQPVSKKELSRGTWLYDLGQNFSGIPAIKVSGKKGDTIRLRPAELITKEGAANQGATGSPHIYTYVLKGNGVEEWQPRFTYYGFRYVQVEGAAPEGNASGLPVIRELKGLHIRNSAPEIGSFSSSNELFNKTNDLIRWAIRSNMVSVFTDCPHREKLGWLEETHLMGSSVQYNYDIAALCKKVVRDMINAQTAEGLIPDIAPEYVHFDGGFRDSPEWGSAGVIFTWYAFQWYGDTALLKEAYPMMKKYVSYLKARSKNHILEFGLSDWYDIGPQHPGVSQLTPMGVTATATYYYNLTILSKVAALLGIKADLPLFQNWAKEVKTAFNKKFFNPQTRQYATGSQAANAMALYMNLVEPEYRNAVVQNLVKDIRGRNNALTGGDVGYRYVLRALEDAGYSDVIYDMNNRSDVPGYGYQLAHGATALTESWAALPSVSNNHFMLGHLMEWFYSGLCGIRQAEGSVGFRDIEIRPHPAGTINNAKASYHSVRGMIKVDWKKEGSRLTVNVEIPANTRATIYFPPGYDRAPVKTGSGRYSFSAIKK